MLMKSGLQEQEVKWAKETEEEPKKDDRTNSWAGLRNVTLFTQTFVHILCSNVNCQRIFKHSNFQVCHFFIKWMSFISVTFHNSSFGFPSIMETQSPMLRRLWMRLWRQRCWCLEQAWMFFCDTRGNLSQFLKLKS